MKFSVTDYNHWELQYFLIEIGLRKIGFPSSSHIGTQIYCLIRWGKDMIEKVEKLESEATSLRKELEECKKSQ